MKCVAITDDRSGHADRRITNEKHELDNAEGLNLENILTASKRKRVVTSAIFGGLLLALVVVIAVQKLSASNKINRARLRGRGLAFALFDDFETDDLFYSTDEIWSAYKLATNSTVFFTSPMMEHWIKLQDYSFYSAPQLGLRI